MKYDASTENEELSLIFNENNGAQFMRDGVVIAEVSPDGNGGWNHWGTESLHGNEAFDALMVVTLDSNLQSLSQSKCSTGYWECVGKVLACEGYSIACAAAVLSIPEACAVPCAATWGAGCLFCIGGCIDLSLNYPCKKAYDCWKQASNMGCVPW
jgi:hypothetical protein